MKNIDFETVLNRAVCVSVPQPYRVRISTMSHPVNDTVEVRFRYFT